MTTFSTSSLTIDLRDIWDQFSDLRSSIEAEHEEYTDAGGHLSFNAWLRSDYTGDDRDEFLELERLVEALERAGLRRDNLDEGELIAESHMKVWVRDRLMDELPVPGSTWSSLPFSHIDWEAVAKDYASDYSIIEWEGETFYLHEG